MSSERIPLFDNVKFGLILLVVIGHFFDCHITDSHAMQAAFAFIYSFHMPLFLFVSGLMHDRNKLSVRRVAGLFCCGLLLKIMLLFSRLCILQGKTVTFTLLSESGLPWFLFALAVFELLAYFTRELPPVPLLILAFLFSLISGYDPQLGPYLILSRLIVFFPFYLLGCLMRPEQLAGIAEKIPVKIISCLVLIGFAALCFFRTETVYYLRPLFTGQNSFAFLLKEHPASVAWLYRALTTVLALVLSAAFLFAAPCRSIPLITRGGAKTVQIYFWHYPFIHLAERLCLYDSAAALLSPAAAKLLYAVLPVLLSVFLLIPLFGHPCTDFLNPRNFNSKSNKVKNE